MHLADAFIQSDLHCIQVTVYILSALAFPGNRSHDLGVASAMLYYLSYRKATGKLFWCNDFFVFLSASFSTLILNILCNFTLYYTTGASQ